jgi:pimeloyl-ACP methyl ester carboxylesterase
MRRAEIAADKPNADFGSKVNGGKMALIRSEEAADATAISVDDGGSGGIPVIFVHSLAGNALQWSSQLEHLRKERRAIALDLRGHGLSESPRNGEYSIDSLAEDIESVADASGLQRFILVGHSLGATVSIDYAGRYPEKVAGLLLADPSGDARKLPAEQIQPFLAALESESYAEVIEGYWKGLLVGSDQGVRERVMQDLHKTRRETVVEIFKQSIVYDPLTPLRGYLGPKLSVITHLNDAPFSLHNLLGNLPHVKMSGTGHWLQMDRPDEFNRILDVFLLSIEKA